MHKQPFSHARQERDEEGRKDVGREVEKGLTKCGRRGGEGDDKMWERWRRG